MSDRQKNIRLMRECVRWGQKKSGSFFRLPVGVGGFEPPTSSSRTMRATGLRYTPIS